MIASQDFWSTPRLFPHRLDIPFDRVVLVERDEAQIRAASFLDDRSLDPQTKPLSVAWAQLGARAPATARRDAQFIFHIGHVGSTLISRLLGEVPEVLALREPLVLRGFADQLQRDADCYWKPGGVAARLDTLVAWLSRTFRPQQRALVKATSFVSDIADRVLPPGSKALMLWVPPDRYIASILAGDASKQEMHILGPARVQRLNRGSGVPLARLWELGEGERAALGWAVEMAALRRAAAKIGPDRVLWMDFDTFLAAPTPGLMSLATLFNLSLEPAEAAQISKSPIMHRYSKAMEFDYSPDLRRDLLAQSRVENSAELSSGLRWLEQLGAADPTHSESLQFALGGQ